MEARTAGTVINVLVMTAYGVGAAWRGYHRRKEHWTRASWLGFGATLLVGLSLITVELLFSLAVDKHEPWVGAAHSGTRDAWILVMLGPLIGGPALTALTLGWFAVGKPTRPFPLFGSRRLKSGR